MVVNNKNRPGAANTRAFQNAISKYNRKYLFEVKDLLHYAHAAPKGLIHSFTQKLQKRIQS